MPLDEIRSVLDAPDVATRNQVIVSHLERMEAQLAQTQSTVASLRSLLERPAAPVAVQYRSMAAVTALAITQSVAATDFEAWWAGAFGDLFAALRAAGAAAAGPSGALYPSEFFERERGDVVAFVPVSGAVPGLPADGRASIIEVPSAELAVVVHQGPLGDLDQAYGALGTYVTAREIGVEGPIREYYLVSPLDTDDESRHVTEVCWPVFRTT
jgi:effector-binding domain-containing protein